MDEVKTTRKAIRLSLSLLAHEASVSRFRLWSAEQGTLVLTPEEQARVWAALRNEAARIEGIFRALESVSGN